MRKRGAANAGYNVAITVPSTDFALPAADNARFAAPAPPGNASNDFAAAEAGWKAALAAGLAAARDTSIVGYALYVKGMSFTLAQENSLHGLVRTSEGAPQYSTFPKIGSVPVNVAIEQLKSNLKSLSLGLGPSAVEATSVDLVPVAMATGSYGLEADIKLSAITVLRGHLTDVVDGLATGLVGNPDAIIEGLAINVVDNQGRRAGWWRAERAASGDALLDPGIEPPTGGRETVRFRNLTGGPAVSTMFTGAPAGAQHP